MRGAPRERDALGRPLPRGKAGVPEVPPDPLPPAETLTEAQRYWDLGRAFAAHEVLEACWKASPARERGLWQGLAQLAVGYTHLQRENRLGGARLLRRGAERLEPFSGGRPHGVDVDGLVAWAHQLAREAESRSDGAPSYGAGGVPGPPPRLVRDPR